MLRVALAVGSGFLFGEARGLGFLLARIFFPASTGSECSNMGRGELAESNLSLSSGNMREI